VTPFVASYRCGKTPNPCINCNKAIKFGAFLNMARDLGYDYIATGHYARVACDRDMDAYRLCKGVFEPKDQSYVLYHLTQEQLASVLMPLGDYNKEEVRALAREGWLRVHSKLESQDICFIPDGDYASFLDRYTGCASSPGDFIDSQGRILGRHTGISHYTIGQRKGLGISANEPLFVSAIDAETNTVVLGAADTVWSRALVACDVNWINPPPLNGRLEAKIRYGHQAVPATVSLLTGEGRVEVVFDDPQRAVTPGQAVVFYDGPYMLGGGTIE
jgi:tRNA-specific 2-thiouridylase